MTLPLVNRARSVAFVVTGGGKKDAVRQAVMGPPSAAIPASLVCPTGELAWFLDTDAASLLQ